MAKSKTQASLGPAAQSLIARVKLTCVIALTQARPRPKTTTCLTISGRPTSSHMQPAIIARLCQFAWTHVLTEVFKMFASCPCWKSVFWSALLVCVLSTVFILVS